MFPISDYPYSHQQYYSYPQNQFPLNFVSPYNYFYVSHYPRYLTNSFPIVPPTHDLRPPQLEETYQIPRDHNQLQSQSSQQPSVKRFEPQQSIEKNGLSEKKGLKESDNPWQSRKVNSLWQASEVRPELSRFVKKNTESNIINQIFSFMWSPEKSQQYLSKMTSSRNKIQAFYSLMRAVKMRCKSHLNRTFLRQIFEVQKWPLSFKKVKGKLKEANCLDNQELALFLRKLSFIYLRQISRNSVVTSKKMNQRLWDLHFKKCRQILEFILDTVQT